MRVHGIAIGALILLLLVVPAMSQRQTAADWPQFGGPLRNFHARSSELASSWPSEGPRRLWSRTLGEGFSGIAVADGMLYTMFRRGNDDVIVALDAATGTTRWEHAAAATVADGQDLSQGPGPHATPLVAGDLVCGIGVTADLRCLDSRTGRLRWSHNLTAEFGATIVFRGYSSSPLAHGDSIIVQSGGTDHALIAFDRAGGAVRWHAGSRANANGSPILATVNGRAQVIGFFSDGVAGHDAATGKALWAHPHPQRFQDNIALPILVGNQDVVVSSSLDGGTRRLAITADAVDQARERWHQPRMGTYYTNIASVDGMIVGSSGGVGPTFFSALDAATGEMLWQSRDLKRANFVVAGSHLVMRDEEGALVLARVTRKGVEQLAAVTMLAAGAPSPPTVVGTTVYARDRSRIVALELPAGK